MLKLVYFYAFLVILLCRFSVTWYNYIIYNKTLIIIDLTAFYCILF
nr:MAG TPA: hypothetical protein [Bacteriophage sp.]